MPRRRSRGTQGVADRSPPRCSTRQHERGWGDNCLSQQQPWALSNQQLARPCSPELHQAEGVLPHAAQQCAAVAALGAHLPLQLLKGKAIHPQRCIC